MLTSTPSLGRWFGPILCCMTIAVAASSSVLAAQSVGTATKLRESSATVQQIVAHQEEHFRKIGTAQGTVVWTEKSGAARKEQTRILHFARQGDNAVTLALPREQAAAYAGPQSKMDWSKVIAANLIVGDMVQAIDRATTSGGPPIVNTLRYNPAVHDNNPLGNYHLRHMGDDTIPLRELAASIPQMKTRPRVFESVTSGQLVVYVEFANSSAPGEKLVYTLDPSRAWLATEIARISNDKYLSLTKILIGHTKDGTWVPARKERTQFDASGRLVLQDDWYYEHLAVNEPLPPQTFSLMFFRLPLGTVIKNAPQPAKKAKGPAGNTPVPSRRTPAQVAPTGMIRLY
jgi:hypothetical protein